MRLPFLYAFSPWLCWMFGHKFKDSEDVQSEVNGRWVPAQYCPRCMSTRHCNPKYEHLI